MPLPPLPLYLVCHVPGVACRSGVGRRRHESLTTHKYTTPAAPFHAHLVWTDYLASCRCPATTEPDPPGRSTPSRPGAPVLAATQPEQQLSAVPHLARCGTTRPVRTGQGCAAVPLGTPHSVALSPYPASEYDALLTSQRSQRCLCPGGYAPVHAARPVAAAD